MMYYIEYNSHTHFFHSLTCFHISSASEKIPLVPLVRDGVKRVCAVCVSVMTQSRCMVHVRVRVCLDEFMMDEKQCKRAPNWHRRVSNQIESNTNKQTNKQTETLF